MRKERRSTLEYNGALNWTKFLQVRSLPTAGEPLENRWRAACKRLTEVQRYGLFKQDDEE